VKTLTVLVTGSGAAGTAALLRALRMNGERAIRLIGIDASPHAIGRHFCDRFYVVPNGRDPSFADTVLGIAQREHADAVLPQSPSDVLGLAEAREQFQEEGIVALVSPPEAVRLANDKTALYARLERIGVQTPAWRLVVGGRTLREAAQELGYPQRSVCFVPTASSNSAGFCVLDATFDRARQVLDARPEAATMRLTEVLEALPEEGGPELLVMELAAGRGRTVDGIARGGRILLGHPKTREAMSAGVAMYFETIHDPELMEVAQRITADLNIDHFFNIQLVGDHVIEVNPYISTIVYQQDLNLPYLGLKHALGELTDEQLGAVAWRVRPTRRALRYFDQVEWDEA
jgi:carbamoyl-phosphate synthase large subunit